MFYRWYLTPKKISKMSNQSSNGCWKCKKVVGSFFHMWWTCGEVMYFWKRIHCWLQIILNIRFEMCAKFYLLSIPPSNMCSKLKNSFFMQPRQHDYFWQLSGDLRSCQRKIGSIKIAAFSKSCSTFENTKLNWDWWGGARLVEQIFKNSWNKNLECFITK